MTGPPVILPPFDEESALRKVQVAQDAWNTRDPERVALAYTEDSQWRNRDEFFTGREAIKDFLRRKWARELDYVLRKELWCYQGNRISVRFEYESHDADGQWWRSHGNEHWEFDEATGLMRRRDASINDYRIDAERAADRDGLSAPRSAAATRSCAAGSRTVRRRWSAVRPGKEAHGRTAMPCSRRRRAAAPPRADRRARSSRPPGGRWRRGPRRSRATRSARRVRSRARWPAACSGWRGDGLDGREGQRVDRPRRALGAQPRGQRARGRAGSRRAGRGWRGAWSGCARPRGPGSSRSAASVSGSPGTKSMNDSSTSVTRPGRQRRGELVAAGAGRRSGWSGCRRRRGRRRRGRRRRAAPTARRGRLGAVGGARRAAPPRAR